LDRCDRHPGNPAVARCDGCGRPMCLACSTPVRGQNFGSECLADVLGPDAGDTTDASTPRPDRGARTFALAGFGVAVLATALPWSRFGPGSGAFGAWTRSGHWSLVAALAAIGGLIITAAQLRSRLRDPGWDVAIVGLGAFVVVASLLSVLFPPAFSRPWLGPWLAVVAGAMACGTSILAARSARNTSAVGI
ncbi:MAG TPA: B-box zinc finger protein, partial [Actinomycetota bacterium]|nr:B-box zinc finger protein [Actinomycetota bacterium]